MRILMLNNEFPPKGGGMGTANKALFEQFVGRQDLQIDLITSSLENRFHEEQFAENIHIYYVPVGSGNIHHATNIELVRYAMQAYLKARKLLRQHSYDFSFAWSAVPAGGVALALEKMHRLPFMTWISGPDTPGFERRYDYLFPVLQPILKVIWRNSQPLIAKCQEEVDLIQAVAPGQPVEIIPNGVDLNRFQPVINDRQDQPLIAVCAARLIERKGQHHLIEAASRLKSENVNVVIRLIGDGDSYPVLKNLARGLDVLDRVEFLGYVPPNDIAGHLQIADVFVLPSYFEGVSLATLEAMGSGLPVIVTRTGGTEEMIREGLDGFFVDWNDVDAIFAKLALFANDRELVRRMGRSANEHVQKYRWEIIANAYAEVFQMRNIAINAGD